jgi:inosine-uridine nucleoside N-ribohydrolase
MPQPGRNASPGAFFDSDFSTIDSVLAISLLYGLQGKSDCRVAIITVSRPNLAVTGFVDAVQRFYHGAAGNFSQLPPIGMDTAGAPGETSPAFTAPFQKKKLDGTPAYKNLVKSVIDTGDPTTLIRNYLEAQIDHTAFFVLAGPATNLAAALAYPGLIDLIAKKVKYLVMAGGAFPTGQPEAHVQADIAAAKKVLAGWPTPIVAAGAEVGSALEFPGASIDKQFAEAVPDNPVADAYRAYQPMPYNAPSWAMAAALYAARPKEGYFKLSDPGRITVDDQGRTSFTASEKGNRQYLIVDPAQKDKIILAYIELASAKPEAPRRFRPPDQPPPPAGKTAGPPKI